jgi:hypothetical protein
MESWDIICLWFVFVLAFALRFLLRVHPHEKRDEGMGGNDVGKDMFKMAAELRVRIVPVTC